MIRSHPCYQGRHSHYPSAQRYAERILRAGPWFWPCEGDEEAGLAAEVTGVSMPEARAGQVPLVAYHSSKHKGSVWLLEPEAINEDENVKGFLRAAQESWACAVSAVPRSVPLLWKSLQPIARQPLRARFIGSHGGHYEALDDLSFGLSFALSIVSRLADTPLPVHVAASATIDEFGHLGKVGELGAKIDALLDFAPQVTEFIVASAQQSEAEELAEKRLTAARRLKIVAFQTLTDVVGHVFNLSGQLIRWGDDEERRAELIEQIFRLTAGHSESVRSWLPVGRAAADARKHWPGLSVEECQKLDFAHAVAYRHDKNKGSLPLPERAWLDKLPHPLRLSVVAHTLQQSADTGTPPPEDTLAFVRPFVVRGPDAFPGHLRILGALGRLHYTLGNYDEALELQLQSLNGWMSLHEFNELSYPITFGYHIAGARNDRKTIEKLDKHEEFWRLHTPGSSGDRAFVNNARGRALALMGAPDRAESLLRETLETSHLRLNVRQTALRWLVFCLEERGESAQAEAALTANELLEPKKQDDGSIVPNPVRILIEMDRALRRGDSEAAEQAADEFVEHHSNVIARVLAYAKLPDGKRAAFIQRYAPYY